MPRIRVNRSKTHRRKLSKKGGETPKYTDNDLDFMEKGIKPPKITAPLQPAYNYDTTDYAYHDEFDPELRKSAKQVNVYEPSAPPPPPALDDFDEPVGKYQVVSPQKYDLYEYKLVTEVPGSKKGDWSLFDGIFTGGKKRRTRKNNKRTRKARKSRTNRK